MTSTNWWTTYPDVVGRASRATAFHALDRATGNTLRHLRSIERYYAASPSERSCSIEWRRSTVMAAARGAYARVLGSKLPATDDLAAWPLLTKADLRTIAAAVPARVASASRTVTTSGSGGMPLQLPMSPFRHARQHAEILYYTGWFGYHVGDPHAYVSISGAKTRLTAWMQNEQHLHADAIGTRWCRDALHHLAKRPFRVLIGYPSTLEMLAVTARENRDALNFDIGTVVTIGEPLEPSTRSVIREMFGCPTVSRYAARELGVVAHECEHERFHVNSASFEVELIDDAGRPVTEPGRRGRVVVTDLFARRVPIVRYELGDLATWDESCDCGRPGPTFGRVDGRTTEVIDAPDGTAVSGFRVNSALRHAGNIRQFQFQQLDEGYRILVVPSGSMEDARRDLAEATHDLRSVLGEDARIRIERVDAIPADASGKRPNVKDLRDFSPDAGGASGTNVSGAHR